MPSRFATLNTVVKWSSLSLSVFDSLRNSKYTNCLLRYVKFFCEQKMPLETWIPLLVAFDLFSRLLCTPFEHKGFYDLRSNKCPPAYLFLKIFPSPLDLIRTPDYYLRNCKIFEHILSINRTLTYFCVLEVYSRRK